MKIGYVLIAICIVSIAGLLFLEKADVSLGGGISVDKSAFGAASTSTNITVNTTSTLVLGLNQDRSYARITNTTGNRLWCEASSIGATSTEGFLLVPVSSSTGDSYIELGPSKIPAYGSIYCIADGAASVASIVEN